MNLSNRTIQINICPLSLIPVVYFYCYFFNGFGVGNIQTIQNGFYSALLESIIHIGYIGSLVIWYLSKDFKLKAVVSIKLLIPTILVCIIGFIWYNSFVYRDLTGDQLFHVSASFKHLIYVISIFSKQYDLDSLNFGRLLFKVVYFFMLLGFILFYFLLLNRKYFSVILISLIGIIFRLFLYRIDYPLDFHPPLRTLPIQISAVLFGLSSFGLSLFGFLFFLFIIAYRIFTIFPENIVKGLCLVLLVFSVPVFGVTSILIEQSLYFLTIGTLILLSIQRAEKLQATTVFSLIFISCIFSMIRFPMIVFVLVLFLFYLIRFKNLDQKILQPIFLILPLYLITFLVGHPASTDELFLTIPSILEISKLLIVSIFNSYWIFGLFSIICFVIFAKRLSILIWTLLLSTILIFFSIRYELWGVARYQTEIFGPFFILAIIGIGDRYFDKFFIRISVLIVFFSNVYLRLNFTDWNNAKRITHESYYMEIKKLGGFYVQSEMPLPITSLNSFIKNIGANEKVGVFLTDLNLGYLNVTNILNNDLTSFSSANILFYNFWDNFQNEKFNDLKYIILPSKVESNYASHLLLNDYEFLQTLEGSKTSFDNFLVFSKKVK